MVHWPELLPVNTPADFATAIGLLVLAVILGGAIGLERELRRRPGGLRTSAFICFGATMFTLASEVLARHYGGDPQRIAAQIIPGIGFLGAGAIIRDRGGITGLTSAATVFVVASIGMAIGGGMAWYAVVGTVIVLGVLRGFAWLETRLRLKTTSSNFIVFGADPPGIVTAITALVERQGNVLTFLRTQAAGTQFMFEFGVRLTLGEEAAFLRALRSLESISVVCPTTETGAGRSESAPSKSSGSWR